MDLQVAHAPTVSTDSTARDTATLVKSQLASTLNARGLPTSAYIFPAFDGYASLTNGLPVDVFSVQSLLGTSANDPCYHTCAIAQTFLPAYPTLALTAVVDVHAKDGYPSTKQAKLTIEIDRKLSTLFLPTLFNAFNALDPTGQNRCVLVQSYNSELSPLDLILASKYTLDLLQLFQRDGQLAMIAVDYYDYMTTSIAKLMSLGKGLLGKNIHLVRRTNVLSPLKIPLADPRGGYYLLDNSSTALDQGFALALSYLDQHYRAFSPSSP
jgi:hypothetical protein